MDNVEGMHSHSTDHTNTDHIAVRTYTALFFAGLLASCTVGPDFKPPAASDAPGYTATPCRLKRHPQPRLWGMCSTSGAART